MFPAETCDANLFPRRLGAMIYLPLLEASCRAIEMPLEANNGLFVPLMICVGSDLAVGTGEVESELLAGFARIALFSPFN